jgi:uncharacterized protein YbjT (DUF2867 family)
VARPARQPRLGRPAISHLRRPDVAADQVARYLADLERLAASMFVRRVDITRRIERYGQVLEAMERGTDLHAPGSPLQLSVDVSPFALTSQVLGQTEWTPEVLERRQGALLDKLIELWRL